MEFNPLVRAVSTVALAATAFFTVAAFMTLPADAVLAVHWNIDGAADGFAGREALLIVPITTVVVGGLLWLAVRNDPKRANIARSADALGLVVMALALLVAVTQSAIINSGFGEAARLDHAVPLVAGAFFAILGYAMPNIRQNYTIASVSPGRSRARPPGMHRIDSLAESGSWLAPQPRALGSLALAQPQSSPCSSA